MVSEVEQSSTEPTLLKPEARVLSTLESDGSRRWLYPKLSKGRLWQARRWIAYGLIAIYALVPYIHVGGKPMVLIDVVHRQFHLFGFTFLPTDTKLLAVLLLMVGLTIFTATALLGRVWCGWACPQTVYMEFVFRPIERLFTGTVSRGGKPKKVAGWRVFAMYVTFFLISVHLAHTLLAYFIGAESVHRYIWSSTPLAHPGAFIVVALATAWIMWDFAYWREQMCIIGCPYGRMQSVLLDRGSRIVSYDQRRGEPRGRMTHEKADRAPSSGEARAVALQVLPEPAPATANTGDCINCMMCVQVCPTGIDIRDGLQLECVNCAQCIDACDHVMDKIGRPRGLIGYSSQARRTGEPKKFRPRVVIYPALLGVLAILFVYLLATQPAFDMTVLRSRGRPFNVLADNRIENTMRIKLVNRSRDFRTYKFELLDAEDGHISVDVDPELNPLQSALPTVRIAIDPELFKTDHVDVRIRVSDNLGKSQIKYVRLIGPIASLNRNLKS